MKNVKNNCGINLLRVLLTFMICILHTLGHGGVLSNSNGIYNSTYWLKRDDNSNILKRIIDYLGITFPSEDYVPTIDENQEVHIEIYKGNELIEDIHFPKEFPIEPPVIINSIGKRIIGASSWDYNDDIFTSFINYYITSNKSKL